MAAIEFALVVTVFVPLVVGACDFGLLMYEQMAIDNAAWAGASQAALHGWTSNSPTDIENAATAASGYAPTSVSAVEEYGCDNHGTIAPAGKKSGKCQSGLSPGLFVVVTATAAAPLTVPLPSMPSSFTLSSTMLTRLK